MDDQRPLNPAIVKRLHSLLETSDLDVTTEKHIRLQLEAEFKVDLSERKKTLRLEIQNYLNSRQQDDDEEPEQGRQPSLPPPTAAAKKPRKEKRGRKRQADGAAEGDERKKRSGGGLMKMCALSPELGAFLGVPQLPRTEVVQGIWKYIKEHGLQDPANKRVINCDAALEKLLGAASTDMFQLNKLLKVHIQTIPGDGAPKPALEDGTSGGSGTTGPLPMSPALCRFVNTGEYELPRSEAVRRVWDYVKDHNLQDPQNKRGILCDATLKELLGVDYIDSFGSVPKLLSPHLGTQFQQDNAAGDHGGLGGGEEFHGQDASPDGGDYHDEGDGSEDHEGYDDS